MSKAVDAMALWEAYIHLCADQARSKCEEEAYQKIVALRELQGTCELRETFYELAGFANAAWSQLPEEDRLTITEYHALDAWDWDYLPFILIKCAVLKCLEDISIDDFVDINADLLMQASEAQAKQAA